MEVTSIYKIINNICEVFMRDSCDCDVQIVEKELLQPKVSLIKAGNR